MPPATIWKVRSAVMPGARSGLRRHLRQPRHPVGELASAEQAALRAPGPAAATRPAARATGSSSRSRSTCSFGDGPENVPTASARTARHGREAPHLVGVGGSSCRNPIVLRPAPSGTETATSGYSSTPAAISSEPPPMSRSRMLPGRPARPAADRQECQARLVLAREHLEVDAGLAQDPIEHRRPVRRLADARRSRTAAARRCPPPRPTRIAEAIASRIAGLPSSLIAPSGVMYRISRSTDLCVAAGIGRAPGARPRRGGGWCSNRRRGLRGA